MGIDKKIRVVIVPENGDAYVQAINNTYETIRDLVGGYERLFVEFTFNNARFVYIFSDTGKINGSNPNRAVYLEDGEAGDILFGNFIVAKVDEDEESISLDEDEAAFIVKEMNDRTRDPYPFILQILANKNNHER